VMDNPKDYSGDPEKLLGPLEANDARQREQFAKAIVRRLDTDRKKAGMKTAEMYQIAESRGVEELRAEIDRRLKNVSIDI
jgi:hypothetical protein